MRRRGQLSACILPLTHHHALVAQPTHVPITHRYRDKDIAIQLLPVTPSPALYAADLPNAAYVVGPRLDADKGTYKE